MCVCKEMYSHAKVMHTVDLQSPATLSWHSSTVRTTTFSWSSTINFIPKCFFESFHSDQWRLAGLYSCRVQLPRWSVFLFGGVMSHTELLRQFPVAVVWFTQRWLIVLLSVITSQAPWRQILHPPAPRTRIPPLFLLSSFHHLPLFFSQFTVHRLMLCEWRP